MGLNIVIPTSHDPGNSGTDFGYDPLGRPTSRAQLFGQPGYDAYWSFQYNPAGGLAGATRDHDAYAWQGHYAVIRPPREFRGNSGDRGIPGTVYLFPNSGDSIPISDEGAAPSA